MASRSDSEAQSKSGMKNKTCFEKLDYRFHMNKTGKCKVITVTESRAVVAWG